MIDVFGADVLITKIIKVFGDVFFFLTEMFGDVVTDASFLFACLIFYSLLLLTSDVEIEFFFLRIVLGFIKY